MFIAQKVWQCDVGAFNLVKRNLIYHCMRNVILQHKIPFRFVLKKLFRSLYLPTQCACVKIKIEDCRIRVSVFDSDLRITHAQG